MFLAVITAVMAGICMHSMTNFRLLFAGLTLESKVDGSSVRLSAEPQAA